MRNTTNMRTVSQKNLCIDVGNHRSTYGFFSGGRILSGKSVSNDVFPQILKKSLKNGGNKLNNVIISCVVPKMSQKIRSLIPKKAPFRVTFVSSRTFPELKVNYSGSGKLGADRLTNLFGMYRCLGGGLVIDLGTAVTYDWISPQGVFKGGLILPGLRTSLDGLYEKTAALPRVPLTGKFSFPAHSTVGCIRSGILKGYGEMTKGLIKSFRDKFKSPRATVVITGGDVPLLRPHLKGLKHCHFDPFFTLFSLNRYAHQQWGKTT